MLRADKLLCVIAACLAATTAAAQAASNLPKSVTLSYESLLPDSQSVKPLATILYDPDTLKFSISSWTPPSLDSLKSTTAEQTSSQLLRITLPNGSSSLTSLGTFNTSLSQNVDLHLSPSGDNSVSSASVYATTPIVEVVPKGSKSKNKSKSKSKSKSKKKVETQENAQANASVQVKIIAPRLGATPKLVNKKPPVVGPDGREQPAEGEVEKSFFQKYWWIFAIVTLIAMTGGGDK